MTSESGKKMSTATPPNSPTGLFFDIKPSQCPIIYSPKYDITFYGLEKCHAFDTTKWGKAHKKLIRDGVIAEGQTVVPNPVTDDDLLKIHTPRYLNSLKSKGTIARVAELCPLVILPSSVLNSKILVPLRYHTGGSILGTKLARERGWAINLGGGFHHCSSDQGSGFCYYADISLCVKFLLDEQPLHRILIVDLDAHQGNGHERDWGNSENVFILDAFNNHIYPRDKYAMSLISSPVLLDSYTGDKVYLEKVGKALKEALVKFTPTFVIYNAGTDLMENDPLGRLSITRDGVIERDRLVFSECVSRDIPILMVTSGGYQPSTADVIADSIKNLVEHSLICI